MLSNSQHVSGLLNRLSESNVESVTGEIAAIFRVCYLFLYGLLLIQDVFVSLLIYICLYYVSNLIKRIIAAMINCCYDGNLIQHN